MEYSHIFWLSSFAETVLIPSTSRERVTPWKNSDVFIVYCRKRELNFTLNQVANFASPSTFTGPQLSSSTHQFTFGVTSKGKSLRLRRERGGCGTRLTTVSLEQFGWSSRREKIEGTVRSGARAGDPGVWLTVFARASLSFRPTQPGPLVGVLLAGVAGNPPRRVASPPSRPSPARLFRRPSQPPT